MAISFEIVFFGVFAGIAVILAIMMLSVKSPVHAALCLVGVMIMLAILYLMLHAYFLSVVQIVVYAGAVMVLFLFVIMFFYSPGASDPSRMSVHFTHIAGAIILAVILLAVITGSFLLSGNVSLTEKPSAAQMTDIEKPIAETSEAPLTEETSRMIEKQNPQLVGRMLFTKYLLPFELTSLLLLAAMVGAVVLARRSPPAEAGSAGGDGND
ncbi:NADH-quinone oxidoreductase subunit J [bacterium]|nr:NADH-quinone oxidoreductase subunit J [bacterium]